MHASFKTSFLKLCHCFFCGTFRYIVYTERKNVREEIGLKNDDARDQNRNNRLR